MMHAPLFALRTSSVRDVHCIYLPPTITHGWGGPVPGMAFRPKMTHAIPTCCQVASRTTSVRGVYCRYLHPTISTWLGWARSGHGVPPGDDSRYPHLLSAAAAEENPAYPLRCLLGQKCDWCQLRPRLCKWGPWIQRNMKSHSTSALVGALICRVVAIADPPVLKHWVHVRSSLGSQVGRSLVILHLHGARKRQRGRSVCPSWGLTGRLSI